MCLCGRGGGGRGGGYFSNVDNIMFICPLLALHFSLKFNLLWQTFCALTLYYLFFCIGPFVLLLLEILLSFDMTMPNLTIPFVT